MGGLVTKSCPTLAVSWTVACQAPLSIGFSRQEYWSGLPFPSPGNLPNPGFKPGSPAWQADSLLSELQGKSHILNKYLTYFHFSIMPLPSYHTLTDSQVHLSVSLTIPTPA